MLAVAAAMIVRDEEGFLPGCLESLQGKVDEILVVDTGSNDATIEIAEKFGARVLPFRWNDDFAAARNRGLDEVRADWILYIDADERLRTPGDRPLAEFLLPEAIGTFVRFRPKRGYTRYRELRLFKRDPRLRFAGVIHETVVPAIEHLVRTERFVITNSAVEVDHLGYEGDPVVKAGRNIPLLRRAVGDNPGRVYYWYHLAESLAAVGEAEEAAAAAFRGIDAAKLFPSEKQRANASMIYQMLARFYMQRGFDPMPLIEAGLAAMPDDYALQFLEGRARLGAAQYERSSQIAQRLRSIDLETLSDGLLAFDRRIFGEFAHDLAGVAAFRLGRFADAARHFSDAAAAAADAEVYRMKARASVLAGNRASH